MKALNSTLLFVFLIQLSWAQNSQLNTAQLFTQFEHLSMKDGLSMNPVMDLTQDKSGFLWFGTQDGLNRYDGYKIVVYKNNENDSNSISDNFITSLCVDEKGSLWIGTYNTGINRFDPNSTKFIRYNHEDSGNFSAKHNRIFTIHDDGDGVLWVGTVGGIERISINSREVLLNKELDELLSILDNVAVLSIFKDVKGMYWFGTVEGIYLYNPQIQSVEQFVNNAENKNSISNSVILSFFNDSKDNLWVGTMDGLNLYREKTNDFEVFWFSEGESNPNSTQQAFRISGKKKNYSLIDNFYLNTIREVIVNELGNFLIATDQGLIVFNPEDKNFEIFKPQLHLPKSISNEMLRCLYVDGASNLWIGTVGAGVNKLNLNAKKFELFHTNIYNPYKLTSNYIRAILEDSRGDLWIGSVLGGLNNINLLNGEVVNYTKSSSLNGNSISDITVWSITEDNSENIWIGTSYGLNLFDPKNQKFSYYFNEFDDVSSLSNNTVRCVLEGSEGSLFVGTDNGLNLFNKEEGNFKRFLKSDKSSASISDNAVWDIIESRDKTYWIATNNGLYNYNLTNGEFKRYRNIKNDPNSLSSDDVRTLFEDKDGIIWAGTSHGLNKMINGNSSFKRFFEKDGGLPNSFIYCILQDDEGFLWISTNKGIAQFDPKHETFRNYDVNDGAQDYEFNSNTCFKCKSGEMFFGGPNGLNRFDPQQFKESTFKPTVVITEIKIMNKPLESVVPVHCLKLLDLDYTQNVISFEFSTLDFTNSLRNHYAYMMDGFNNEWVYSGTNRYVNYTNLDPGLYHFKVKGTNSDGVWNDQITVLKIFIHPPFWQTWWFRLLIISTLIITIISYIKFREKNLKIRQKELEETVLQRTAKIVEQKNELEKLSIVASKTDNAVIIIDNNGKFEYVNEGFTRLSGFTFEDLKKEFGGSFLNLSENPEIGKILNQCIELKKPIHYETFNKHKLGNKIWTASTLTPIFDEKGNANKIIIIDTDINDRKINEEIIKQKNTDITDSIIYARRIQKAIMVPKEEVYKHLPGSFIIYRPKDIVSGDFYYYSEIDSKIILAVCDCTGHGVPGAFMSMIGNDILNQVVIEKGILKPSEILNQLHHGVKMALRQDREGVETMDGMDIALCVLDLKNNKLEFAGAQRPLYVVNSDMNIYKADNIGIGGEVSIKRKFTNHEHELKKGDTLFIFSDGFTDQFGGPKDKKYGSKKFREKLMSIQNLGIKQKEKSLNEEIDNWMGSREQIDDILVIGVML